MSEISIQVVVDNDYIPPSTDFIHWIELVLKQEKVKGAVTVRVVNLAEITILNSTYRQQDKPTNVLSFVFEAPKNIEIDPILGDIIICAEVVKNEAIQQDKSVMGHFAHMSIHGMLHLLGYDHLEEDQAKVMEQKEINLLQTLGFNNPYQSKV